MGGAQGREPVATTILPGSYVVPLTRTRRPPNRWAFPLRIVMVGYTDATSTYFPWRNAATNSSFCCTTRRQSEGGGQAVELRVGRVIAELRRLDQGFRRHAADVHAGPADGALLHDGHSGTQFGGFNSGGKG